MRWGGASTLKGLDRLSRALLGIAIAGFSLSPPAKRGERVGERGTNMMADECRSGFPV
jgi:hypothetical protein